MGNVLIGICAIIAIVLVLLGGIGFAIGANSKPMPVSDEDKE